MEFNFNSPDVFGADAMILVFAEVPLDSVPDIFGFLEGPAPFFPPKNISSIVRCRLLERFGLSCDELYPG